MTARAPYGVEGFYQPRRAAFWLLIVFLANGVFATFTTISTGYQVVPTTVIVGGLVWTLYAVPFLLFFRALSLFEQHPPLGYVLAFAWGGLAASYLAIPVNVAIQSLAAKLGSPETAAAWGPALAGPISEETLKYVGVVLLVLIARTQFRSLLSVVAIGAMTGLGFQIVENLIYTINTAIQFPSTDQLSPIALMLMSRGLFSGVWSHALYTSISCFGLGYFLTRTGRSTANRLAVAAGSFALAWAVHFFWNSPWLGDLGPSGLPGMFLVTLVKGVPILVVGLVIWRLAGREEAAHLRALADFYLDDEALMTAPEREALSSLHERRHLRKEVTAAHGGAAGRVFRDLQRAQLHLLRLVGESGRSRKAAAAAQEVRELRAELAEATG